MIVVAGEALIDLIPTPTGELSVNPGGGPFNTARWLACLGQSVSFLGALGVDPLGVRLREALADSGVDLSLAVETVLPTTLALAQLDPAGVARYSFYADETSVRGLTVAAVNSSLPSLECWTALQVGGVALVLPPSAMALERSVELARRRGALVQLDPNIRPGLIPDRDDYMRRFEHVLDHTNVLKLSVEDLTWLAPGKPTDQAVSALLGGGPQVVLLTDGGDGATVYTAGSEPTHIPAEKVVVADTIGAGDAFDAGFLAHLLSRSGAAGPITAHSLPEIEPQTLLADREAVLAAARFAARIAAVACAQRGAKPPASLPTVQDT